MTNKLIAIIRGVDPGFIVDIADTLVKNGINWLEVSLSDEEKGLECISRISGTFSYSVRLGVGTVVVKDQVDRAIEAGATYVITPGWDKELVQYVLRKEIPIYPGVLTPGEIAQAESIGIDTVKLFPAGYFGANYIKSLRGPFPNIKIMAVGGVNLNNLLEFKKAGCSVFAIGSELVPKGATKEDLDFIANRSRQFRSLLGSV